VNPVCLGIVHKTGALVLSVFESSSDPDYHIISAALNDSVTESFVLAVLTSCDGPVAVSDRHGAEYGPKFLHLFRRGICPARIVLEHLGNRLFAVRPPCAD